MKIIKIEQGTPEWLLWRKGADLPDGFAITATAAAAIAGTSAFMTAYQLWKEMTGRAQPQPVNRFMMAGTRNEPRARTLYEAHIQEPYSAECIESEIYPWVRASLDGLAMFYDRTAEIKCPGEKSHLEAVAGIIKPGYIDQMQWQMLATDGSVTECDFVSYFKYPDGREEIIVISVKADPLRQKELLIMAERFRQSLINDIPPAGSDFEQAAHVWLVLDSQIKELEDRATTAKQHLISLAPQGGQCAGVSVTLSTRKGTTKWQEVAKAVMALPDVSQVLPPGKIEEVISLNTGGGSTSVTVKATSDASEVLASIREKSKVSVDVLGSNQINISDEVGQIFSMDW